MLRGSSYFVVNSRQVELHFQQFASEARKQMEKQFYTYRTDFQLNDEEAAIEAASGIIHRCFRGRSPASPIEDYDAYYDVDKFMIRDGFVVPVIPAYYVMTKAGWDWANKPRYVMDCPGAEPDMNFTKYLRLHGSELGPYPGMSEALARYNAKRQRVQPQQQHETEPAHTEAEPAHAEAEPARTEAGVKVEPQDNASDSAEPQSAAKPSV